MPLLDIRNLTISIKTPQGTHVAVDRVSLILNEGEIRALVGESGSGKSLIAKVLMGIQKKNWDIKADRISFNDIDLLQLEPIERRKLLRSDIAMIFQDPKQSLNPSESIGSQLISSIPKDGFEGRWWQWSRWRHKQAIALLHKVGIKNHSQIMHSYPHELSDAECQKVMIAMAVAKNPRLLIADEPTNAMEATAQYQILRLLDKLNKLANTTILLISNDITPIANLANSFSVMYSGQVVESGNHEQILQTPHHPYTESLFLANLNSQMLVRHKSTLAVLPGAIPALQNLPVGCRLGPRCPYAQSLCNKTPPLQKIKGHHFYCHYPLNMEESQC